MYIALRRFLRIEAISRQKEAQSRDYALLRSVKFKMADHRPLFDMYDIWKPCQIARPLL